MTGASNFDHVSECLEEQTSLNRLEARGTLRIALKESGFEAKSVQAGQLKVVIERLLPQHLRDRGVSDAEKVCELLTHAIFDEPASDAAETPEAIFARLGSS